MRYCMHNDSTRGRAHTVRKPEVHKTSHQRRVRENGMIATRKIPLTQLLSKRGTPPKSSPSSILTSAAGKQRNIRGVRLLGAEHRGREGQMKTPTTIHYIHSGSERVFDATHESKLDRYLVLHPYHSRPASVPSGEWD